MIYNFVTITDDLEEITITTAELKRENSVIARLVKEADKLFGKGNWVKVPDYDQSLANVVGWYAGHKDGQTLEARAEIV